MSGKSWLWPKCVGCGQWLSNARIVWFAMRWQLGQSSRDEPWTCEKCEASVTVTTQTKD